MKENPNIPIVGKSYSYFDDGKIKMCRRMSVCITEIIHFDKIDPATLELWSEDIADCHWLYAKETDFFIKAELKISQDKTENIFFVRTINNGWFSIGLWGGRLDIDGTLNSSIEN